MSSKIFTFLHKYDFFIKTEVHAEATPSWLGIPIVLNNNCPFSLEEFSSYLEKKGVETRPILTGNILRQPVAEKLFQKVFPEDFEGAEYLHNNGLYIGLSPALSSLQINKLIKVLSSFVDEY